jgi:hypothetical protein
VCVNGEFTGREHVEVGVNGVVVQCDKGDLIDLQRITYTILGSGQHRCTLFHFFLIYDCSSQ